ncbi:hypothetical protein [Paludisphaera soli]|uniref:hypothetical protein n=1 Tax=Paludisphaera soli TaxID=2712865 RepID=UPI0013EA02AA|nr:hypothetical protein [Paludisphaera soli]
MSPIAKRLASVSLVVLVAIVPTTSFGQGGGRNPGVIPPHAKFKGLTYGEWQAKWQQAALAIPVVDGDHPVFSGELFGDEKGIRFLPGLPGGVTIDVTIPAGTALFFPLIVVECSNLEAPPFFGADAAEQADCARMFIDDVTDVSAEIDGKPVRDPQLYRTQSPQYEFSVPASNMIGVPGPATGTSVSEGYFLLLAPLSVGTHTIHFEATYAPFDFTIDTTYIVTVTPR